MKTRRRNKLTQREVIFYKLMQNRNGGKNEYIPVFEFMGEMYVKEVGKWGYVSYECSARLSEMTKRNPNLIGRSSIRGKSGATYYGYRISPLAKPTDIIEEDLIEFYKKVKIRQHHGNEKVQGVRDTAPQHERGEQLPGDSGNVPEVQHDTAADESVRGSEQHAHTAGGDEADAKADDHGVQNRKSVAEEQEEWWTKY